ncbi:MAG: YbaK/EbsC family protein [Conexivisphaerales archaeon]
MELFIKRNGLKAEIISGGDFSSSASAASSLNLTTNEILKSILLICDNKPVIVFLRGSKRISLSKIKKLGFKSARMANEKEIIEVTGYRRGGVPPIDLPENLVKIIDEDIISEETMYAGGGDLDKTLKISIKDVIRINKPKIANISEDQ